MPASVLRRAIRFARSLLLLGLAGTLHAQAMSPPPYLQIFQEQVKVGRAGAHPATEAGWPRAFARAKIPNHYIAMTTVYGPPEAWFSAGVRSIAEIGEQNQAIEKAPGLSRELDRLSQADAVNLTGYRAILARHHSELSNGQIDPAVMRFWEVLIFNVRPGREGNFAEAAKLYRSVVQGAKVDLPWATYQVMSGMPGPVFLVFVPHKTLAEIDPAAGTGAAIEKAMMNEETMKKFSTVSEGFSSVESRIFEVSPEMSYPRPEWVTQDPTFWGSETGHGLEYLWSLGAGLVTNCDRRKNGRSHLGVTLPTSSNWETLCSSTGRSAWLLSPDSLCPPVSAVPPH